ncbi:hypothetical protein THRCLA_21417 [Thraustotheca clavata]|uniref:PX domain-containing protein n=1 Tax=Thraustotheca clavata TaxID=74557 RepID=A0A1V9ZWQ5_9STRA|nr:hypothetical protein THRCLA_21417 [Thraustotheca clavata]
MEHLDIYLKADRDAVDKANNNKRCTMYIIYIKNISTDCKYTAKRRYSDFYELRNQILCLIENHCSTCDEHYEHIKSYPFPGRTLFPLLATQSSVIAERIDSLCLFLKDLLGHVLEGSDAQCTHTDATIRRKLIVEFLELEENNLMPRARPHPAESRTPVLHHRPMRATTSATIHRATSKSPRKPRVAADTCPRCLDKWINCLCEDDDDEVLGPQRHSDG